MISPFPMQRQAPSGWAYLDYPNSDLIIQATTKWERGFRAEACSKEPWTVAWIESMQAGSVFWDIGANVGSYALIAAYRGIYTVALEPGYASYAALCNNVLANRLEDRVTPICAAICEGAGIAPLAYRSTESGAASHAFGGQAVKKSAGTLPTLALSVDDLVSMRVPAPTHMLIDVDGAEPAVLAGAARTLREHAASLMIEVQAEQEETITNLLSSFGYAEHERFTERNGKLMGGLAYVRYERG